MDSRTEKQRLRDEHFARWEMVDRARAQEIARLTDEDVLRIIADLGHVENAWHPAPETSGLVEQQAIFKRWRDAHAGSDARSGRGL